MSRTAAVERNFSGAALTYDSAASFQRTAAEQFAAFIRRHEAERPAPRRILELGAGSGLLTIHLPRLFPEAEITVSDLSESMLAVCRKKFAHGGRERMHFVRADFNGELQMFRSGFDAAFSSMAMQWAEDFDAALGRVARTLHGADARFYLCMPLAGSMETLKNLFESESLSFPGLELPELESIIPHLDGNGFSLRAYEAGECTETYGGLTEFLRSFQLTGTGRISGGRMRPSDLRRLLRKNGTAVRNKYKFAFFICEVRKEK